VLNANTDVAYGAFVANQGKLNILNLGVGLYLYSKKSFFGISGDQLTRGLVQFGNGTAEFEPKIHMNLIGGMKFDMNQNFTLTPSFLVKMMAPAPVSVEATLQGEYKEWLWFGASYRHQSDVVLMAGLNISKKFKFGYSYDHSINRLNNYVKGGHELVLGIMLGRID
jgi:type IX secretion system PorP/SprF family membrane protein